MDAPICNVIYVDRGAGEPGLFRAPAHASDPAAGGASPPLDADLRVLADAFGDVHVCATGASCLSKILELHDAAAADHKPTLVLIDTPRDERVPAPDRRPRSPSPHAAPAEDGSEGAEAPADGPYGLGLLRRVAAEARLRGLSQLVVPITVIRRAPPADAAQVVSATGRAARPELLQRCLDLGAGEVVTSPLDRASILPLEVVAYRAHRAAARERQALLEVGRGRKRSWIGVDAEKPFAYLREAMVSGLMSRICQPRVDAEDGADGPYVAVAPERQRAVADAVGRWHFCAHDFSDDELVAAAAVMFNHALAMPELEPWRIPADQLTGYLLACRAAYNGFVPYHNFRHVVDVLQATFNFLVSVGALPPYGPGAPAAGASRSPVAALLHPFEALTLLITAIGHDVGHPGVNNGFLVTLNAPLAQLYNDRSVLEAFHCAAYSQILRRHWPAAFHDRKMRNLMISSILATDMGLHFDYMKKLADVQEKLRATNSTEGWNGRVLEEQRALACCLLIKCADISNVARDHGTALRWMHILSDEFARQAAMEAELDMPSALMSPPLKDALSLSRAQLNFMTLFAMPLFRGVVEILPALSHCTDELDRNKHLFERRIAEASGGDAPAPAAERPAPPTVTSETVAAAQRGGLRHLGPELADPAGRPPHVPQLQGRYREVTRAAPGAPAAGDPPDAGHGHGHGPAPQRRSDTTDASESLAGAGDWASQATSAATSKMPLSPSTQGTSLVSRDSMDRPASRPGFAYAVPPDSAKSMSETRSPADAAADDDASSHGRPVPDKALKKRPSRFRMNAFPFFRRHKSPSPAAEPA